MDSSSQDRNLPASQRKLQRAREEGQVARSRDLGHLAVLGGGALAVLAIGPRLYDEMRLGMAAQLTFDTTSAMQADAMLQRLQSMAQIGLTGSLIFAGVVGFAAVIGALMSGGWVFSLTPIIPDPGRMSPLQGLQGLISKKRLAETLKLMVIALFVLGLTLAFIHSSLPRVAAMELQPSRSGLQSMFDWLLTGCGLLLGVVFVVALIDMPLQRLLHRSELKMSRQEMKDETKETNGNPFIKGRLRTRQREIAQRQSVQRVPKADFVVMNPTHYAVAVQYDEATMSAPRVISKGADLMAFRIRDLARTHDVPVLQSPVLARALYAHAELDRDIPASLYTAVAQVLAYIYRLRAALRGQGAMPGQMPDPLVPAELDPLQRANIQLQGQA